MILDPIFQAWKRFVETGEIDPQALRPVVAGSWKRCRGHGLNPYAAKCPIRLSPEEIKERCGVRRVLVDAARPFLKLLESAVRGSGFIITLSDEEGYVLEVVGEDEILKMAADNNYLVGCRRTESEVGTNAIGLALHERKAVQLTGYEHFNVNHHLWTCSSSPIFSPNGELLGVITLSGKSIGLHQHTLGMVISAAQAIENKIREEQLSQDKSQLNCYLDSILDSISEGIIAIQKDGRVTHMNRIAEGMLEVSRKAVLEKPLLSAIRLDPKLWQEILESDHLRDQEILLNGRPHFFILSTRPIQVKGENLGKLLILTEKQRVYELINRFAGGHARFKFDDIIGRDPQFLRQIEFLKIAARTDSRILLVGESGTGKELFAQAIHNESKRRNGPFVAVSCAAIPRELIEAELFGYQEGAFTGTRKGGQIGKFELADGGTLFLDEINSMPFEMQAKILRVLQENEVLRLGDRKPRKVDVRVIAAAHRDLIEEVEGKNFREDLYFRLSVAEIFIPPLRERRGDLSLLIEHILKRISGQLKKEPFRLSPEVLPILMSYNWPGNVRELENCLERASILCTDGLIRPELLPHRLLAYAESAPSGGELRPMREEEKNLIVRALKECRGNISESARRLQISRSTLIRRLKTLQISARQSN